MRKVIRRETDIGFGGYYLTLNRAKFMSFTQYSNIDIVLVVPRSSAMTPIEKLFSPFSKISWIALSLTFTTGIVIITLLKLTSKAHQHLVFADSSNPHMNMINILLSGSQHGILPTKDSAKSLLISYVVFCLIIRTLYQAGMFKFLQSDQRHAELQKIDEVIEKKFDIYMYDSFQELSNGLKIHQR